MDRVNKMILIFVTKLSLFCYNLNKGKKNRNNSTHTFTDIDHFDLGHIAKYNFNEIIFLFQCSFFLFCMKATPAQKEVTKTKTEKKLATNFSLEPELLNWNSLENLCRYDDDDDDDGVYFIPKKSILGRKFHQFSLSHHHFQFNMFSLVVTRSLCHCWLFVTSSHTMSPIIFLDRSEIYFYVELRILLKFLNRAAWHTRCKLRIWQNVGRGGCAFILKHIAWYFAILIISNGKVALL